MSEKVISNFRIKIKDYSQLIMLAIVFLIGIVMTKGIFLRPSNLVLILSFSSVFGIMALGQSLVVISGGFDLSVGALMSVTIAFISRLKPGLPLLSVTIIAMLVTVLLGCINGFIVSHTNIPPFIVTLGMMSIARSISWIITTAQQIYIEDFKNAILHVFEKLPMGANIFPVLMLGIGLAITGILLHKSKFGRYIFAIGANENAAVASGVPTKRIKFLVYTLSGFMCSIAAVVFLYRNVSATPGIGEDFLLLTFAATMIGGISMYGGQGTILGAFIGIIIISSLTIVLDIAGVPPVAHKAVLGLVILAVVLIQRWLNNE